MRSQGLHLWLVVLAAAAAAGLSTPGFAAERITPDEAIALAVNQIEWDGDGYRLRNPRHRAQFSDSWVRVGARRAGPEWRWRLVLIEDGFTGLRRG